MLDEIADKVLNFHHSTFLYLDDHVYRLIGMHLDISNLVFILIFFGIGRLIGRMLIYAGLVQITTIMVLAWFTPLYVGGMSQTLAAAICLGLFSHHSQHYMNFLRRFFFKHFGLGQNPIYANHDLIWEDDPEPIKPQNTQFRQEAPAQENVSDEEVVFGKKQAQSDDNKLSIHDKQCLKLLELSTHQMPTIIELKSAFRKVSIKYHPDTMGGDGTHFIRLQQSFDYIAAKIEA